jgi:small-conductance mechanosensitive channel
MLEGPKMKFHGLARDLFVAALLMVPFVSAVKAEPVSEEAIEVPEQPAVPTANVVLDGKVLFPVRGASAYPAEQRARVIVERIVSLAKEPTFKVEDLQVAESQTFSEIKAGDRTILRVYDADARIEQLERQLFAQVCLQRIGVGIEEYRRERRPEHLLWNALYALLSTVLSGALVLLLVRLGRRLDAFVEKRFKQRRVPSLGIKSFEILRAEQIWGALHALLKALRIVMILVIAYVYLNFLLSLFPWTRPFATRLLPYVINPLITMGQSVLEYLPKLAFLILLVLVIRFVLKLLRLFFSSVERGTVTLSGFSAEWAKPTYRLVRVAVVAFAVVLAYPYIPGSDSGAFKGVSIFIGVLVSLGGTSVISNVIAGYTMTYRRAFKLGDRVQINDVIGDVTEMRLLVTHLRSLKNEEIVIPNSVILNSQVVNFTSLAPAQGLILHTTVGIGYEVPWRQVEAMLHMAAERTGGVQKEPGPFVLHKALGDFSVIYELNVFCRDAREMIPIYTDLHRNILDVFNEYGVQIMTPAYEADPAQPKLVPRQQWHTEPAKPG